jgi:hypothetical protein
VARCSRRATGGESRSRSTPTRPRAAGDRSGTPGYAPGATPSGPASISSRSSTGASASSRLVVEEVVDLSQSPMRRWAGLGVADSHSLGWGYGTHHNGIKFHIYQGERALAAKIHF